jgi:3-oxoacyl-[acyl-carrier protein] reductase
VIELTGRRTLVTGGSRGIGRATALLLARAGADVALTYHTRSGEAASVADEIRALGRRAVVDGGDHGDPAVAARVVATAADALGGLDAVIVNHGIWPAEDVPLAQLPPERWSRTIVANLDSAFHVIQAALRRMDRGTIVIVSSTAGQRGEAGHGDYAASKGALISLTKSLAVECAPRITVNCVAPGWVDTDMSAGSLRGAAAARIVATIPMARAATAEEIAGPIVFLCSDLARHITGEILNVNGGSVLCG